MMSLPAVRLAVFMSFACGAGAYVPKWTMSKETLEKFNEFGEQAKEVRSHWNHQIPKHLAKPKRSVAQFNEVLPVSHLGGCGEHVKTSMLGLKRSSAVAGLWKDQSLLELSKSVAPEHPGRESFALPGAGVNQKVKDEGRSKMGNVKAAGQLRGAGSEPFVTVLKDGFWEVGCYFDALQTFSDKYGNEKDKYKPGTAVSIALYDELVLDEKKQPMTPTVCFEFCRTLPDMVYFGISEGRKCYCEPFFKPAPGDDSTCNQACAGDPTNMCGNMKGKSSIFEMHLCETTKTELAEAISDSKEGMDYFFEVAMLAKDLGDKMVESGTALEKVAGLSGAPGAADMGMVAKQKSKDLTQSFMDANDAYETLLAAYKVGKEQESADLSQSVEMVAAEHAIEEMKGTVGAVVSGASKAHAKLKLAFPPVDFAVFGDEPDGGDSAAMKLKSLADGEDYKPDFRVGSYAFDTTYVAKQSSCKGPVIGSPMIGLGHDGCAAACEATVYPDKCVAYSFYTLTGADDLCFMLKEVDVLETFTCPNPSLLQTDKAGADPDSAFAYCGITMSGMATGYKPKGEWKKTDRCFGSETTIATATDMKSYSVPSGTELTMGAVTLVKAP